MGAQNSVVHSWLHPKPVEGIWGPGGEQALAHTKAANSQGPGCSRNTTFTAQAGRQGWEAAWSLGGGLACVLLGPLSEGGRSARPRPQRRPGPILAGAQDSLQVLGQGANGLLDVQSHPLQCRLTHRELVALCPHLQGQQRSGPGDIQDGLGRTRSWLTSFSRSFRTRSTTSTSDLSLIQVSMFCREPDGRSIPRLP